MYLVYRARPFNLFFKQQSFYEIVGMQYMECLGHPSSLYMYLYRVLVYRLYDNTNMIFHVALTLYLKGMYKYTLHMCRSVTFDDTTTILLLAPAWSYIYSFQVLGQSLTDSGLIVSVSNKLQFWAYLFLSPPLGIRWIYLP